MHTIPLVRLFRGHKEEEHPGCRSHLESAGPTPSGEPRRSLCRAAGSFSVVTSRRRCAGAAAAAQPPRPFPQRLGAAPAMPCWSV